MIASEHQPDGLNPRERRAVFSLSGIYALRMMGLFMILPVFALYADELKGSTPALIGLAIGIYGLTQALFQIPYGAVSDRLGRKPVIIAGLLVFAAGSMVAAMADTMWGVIAGRALQGAGAVAAVVMALTADLTREETRLRAMAIIGITIGLSFMVSLVAGPLFANWIGVDGIFWLTAVLALCAVAVVIFIVPNPGVTRFHRDTMTAPKQLGEVLLDGQLLRLDFGVFALHMMLTASFVVVPLALRDQAGLDASAHWYIYLPVMVLAMLLMVPFIIIAEKRRRMKAVFGAAVLALVIAESAFLVLHDSLEGLVFALFVFFVAFNILEASLPSLVAKTVAPDHKGTAMGVYSSSQFMGAFVGGAAGGWLHGMWGMEAVFGLCAVVGVAWFLLAASMSNPRYLSTYMVRVGTVAPGQATHLAAEMTKVRGVAEVIVIVEDGVAYLKVDLHALDRGALLRFSVSETGASSQN